MDPLDVDYLKTAWEMKVQGPVFLARYVATLSHAGQLDKGLKPYIDHPVWVAHWQETEDGKIIGLLHDVLEDSDTTEDQLRDLGFPENIISGLLLLKRIPGEDYFVYIRRIIDSGREEVISVKESDLEHNSMRSRIPNPTQKDFQRWEKYAKALEMIRAAKK